MKTLVISFVLLLVLIVQALGQTDELAQLHGDCSPVDGDGYSFPYFPVDNDTLKILVIFAQFPDDTWDHEGQATYYWPGNLNGIPSWADDIIKPNTTNIGSNNMTAYFKEASRNKFFVIGDVYPTLYWHRNNSAYYKNNSSRLMGKAIVECIEDLDDNINYGDYDKFDPEDFDSDNNKREPDGVIDFILIVHRFHLSVDGFPYTGYAALGGSNERFGLDGLGQPITEFATKDGVTALARFPGSGAISSQINPNSYNTNCHELGHYLLNGHRNWMGMWNLMNTNGNSYVSSDERETLGWHDTIFTPTGNTNYTLSDYGTTGNFIKFSRGGKTYYLENRRRIQYHLSNTWTGWPNWSTSPVYPHSRDSMLFIYNYGITWEHAQGRFGWKKSGWYPTRYLVDVINSDYTRFYIDTANRFTGENVINLINKDVFDQITGTTMNGKRHYGQAGDSNACFDIGYNQVYSPWSNPRIPATGDSDSLAIEITGKDGNGNLQISIYFDNLTQTAPSKPQNLRIAKQFTGSIFSPRLMWYRNGEPDMQKYKIYRGLVTTAGVEPTLSYIGETTDTTYYDAAIDLYDRGGGTGACTYLFKKYTYRVTAFDSTSKESVRSERDSVEGYEDPCAPEESIENIYNPEIRLDYELSQNFPNPFNPITEIRYSFPEVGFVSLKIYDLSGKEVKVLVDEYKQPGQYNIAFDASTLPSGVYFYRIKVNNYSFVRKMLLIK